MSTATIEKTYTCARCSTTTTDPHNEHWMLRKVDLVVAGLTLGLCAHCANGTAAPTDADNCDQQCGGKYQAAVGTYYEAKWGDGLESDTWSCWDSDCVEAWIEDRDDRCEHCGSSVDVDMYEVTDGKRKRVY